MKPLIGITGRQRYSDKDERRIDFVQRPYADAVRRAGGVPFIIPCSPLKEDLSA